MSSAGKVSTQNRTYNYRWVNASVYNRFVQQSNLLRRLQLVTNKTENVSNLMIHEFPNSFKDLPIGQHCKSPNITINDFKQMLRQFFTEHRQVDSCDVYEAFIKKNDFLATQNFEYFNERGVTQYTYNKMRQTCFFLNVKPLCEWIDWL